MDQDGPERKRSASDHRCSISGIVFAYLSPECRWAFPVGGRGRRSDRPGEKARPGAGKEVDDEKAVVWRGGGQVKKKGVEAGGGA